MHPRGNVKAYMLGLALGLVVLALLWGLGWVMNEAKGQERELWPADMGCVTVRTTARRSGFHRLADSQRRAFQP